MKDCTTTKSFKRSVAAKAQHPNVCKFTCAKVGSSWTKMSGLQEVLLPSLVAGSTARALHDVPAGISDDIIDGKGNIIGIG